MVNFLLTVEAGVSHRALAEVATFRVVDAASGVEARPVRTGIGAQLTVVAIKTRWAGALVAIVNILCWVKKKKKKKWLHRCLLPQITL